MLQSLGPTDVPHCALVPGGQALDWRAGGLGWGAEIAQWASGPPFVFDMKVGCRQTDGQFLVSLLAGGLGDWLS